MRESRTIASSEQEAASTLGSVLKYVSRCLLSLTQAFGNKSSMHLRVAIGILGLTVSFVTWQTTMCACGFIPKAGLLGTVPGAAMTCFALRHIKGQKPKARGFALAGALFALYLLAQNIYNVLWSGHDAVFPDSRLPRQERVMREWPNHCVERTGGSLHARLAC
jgi:hypothetical protein